MSKPKTAQKADANDQPKQPERPAPSTIRSPSMTAGPCPRTPNHRHTVVHRTRAAGTIRCCKCNDCGETWELASARDPLQQYAADLADVIESARRYPAPESMLGRPHHQGADVVKILADDALRISNELRALAAGITRKPVRSDPDQAQLRHPFVEQRRPSPREAVQGALAGPRPDR